MIGEKQMMRQSMQPTQATKQVSHIVVHSKAEERFTTALTSITFRGFLFLHNLSNPFISECWYMFVNWLCLLAEVIWLSFRWCWSPEIINCLQVLNVSNNFEFKKSQYLISSFQRIFFGSYFHLTDKLINHPLQHFLSNERKFQINFFPGDECFLPQKPWYQGQFPSQNILQGLLAREKIANTSQELVVFSPFSSSVLHKYLRIAKQIQWTDKVPRCRFCRLMILQFSFSKLNCSSQLWEQILRILNFLLTLMHCIVLLFILNLFFIDQSNGCQKQTEQKALSNLKAGGKELDMTVF